MYRIKTVLLITCIAFLQVSLQAQINTNSPYARYGYGQLSDQTFGNQRAMGGIGYGFRDSKTINSLNPASFSSVDSMTFMLDFGVTGQIAWFDDQTNKDRKFNGNIDYVAMQFPLYKRLGMGIGLKPVSYVGYEYGAKFTSPASYSQTYSGSGGINQLYTSLSYNFFKRFAVGVNAGYMFGDISHNRATSYADQTTFSSALSDTMQASGFIFDVGIQYIQPLSKESHLIIGGVYTPKAKLNEKVMETAMIYNGSGVIENVARKVYEDYNFETPQSLGLGVSYNKPGKLILGADFLLQQWADASFFSTKDTLTNRTKYSVGGEYIINPMSRNFLQRIRYRAGTYYSDSYIRVNGTGYKEYGASFGLGLPMVDNRSMLNLTFEYATINPGTVSAGLSPLNEKYFKFTLSYTFNELWFFKRKVQ